MSLFFNLRIYLAALLCSSLYMPSSYANQDCNFEKVPCEQECCEAPCGKRTALLAGAGLLVAGAAGAIAGAASSSKGSHGDRGEKGERGPSGTPGSSCGSEADVGQEITFNFTLGAQTPPIFGTVPTPFLVTPCGTLIVGEAFPSDWETDDKITHNIVVKNPEFGTYHLGVQFISESGGDGGTIAINNSVLTSREPEETFLVPDYPWIGSPAFMQVVQEFEYGPVSSDIP